ncbi:MAG: DUF86 domain-containing protein [Actinobacteria bacterium]|nr:DUF86 domain-containing protein [Actinomycetota bacterium]
MTGRDYKLFIEDIFNSIEKIEDYVEGMDFDKFIADGKTVDAVIRNLEIIGEAAKNVPAAIRDENPEIPWGRLVGLRNIVSHAYFGIDLKIIWQIITKNLPEIKPLIEELQKL